MVDTIGSSIFPSLPSVNGPAGPSSVSAAGAAETSSSQLVENFDTFLELLVAQIQNQDPTSPTDTDAFTQQLVQFSELEQSIQSNDNLETILSSIQSQNAASVVSYIGSTVTAEGATSTLNNGQAEYNLQATEFIPEAQITIRDASGQIVRETTQSLQAGANSFVFDGVDAEGRQRANGGAFTISVTGENASGNFSNISTAITGVVDGVDFSGATPSLRIGPSTIPLSAVSSVNRTL